MSEPNDEAGVVLLESDDFMHPVEDASNFNESAYYNFFSHEDPTHGGWIRIGKFRLEPRPGNTFERDEELNVYFQIYNPAVNEETSKPLLDIRYTFKAIIPGEPQQIIGAYEVKDSKAQVQGYAVPLKDWPPGSYRVIVSVLDLTSGASIASDEIPFNITE